MGGMASFLYLKNQKGVLERARAIILQNSEKEQALYYDKNAKWLPFFDVHLCEGNIACREELLNLSVQFQTPILAFSIYDGDALFVLYCDGKAKIDYGYVKPDFEEFQEFDKECYSTEFPEFLLKFTGKSKQKQLYEIWNQKEDEGGNFFALDRMKKLAELFGLPIIYDADDDLSGYERVKNPKTEIPLPCLLSCHQEARSKEIFVRAYQIIYPKEKIDWAKARAKETDKYWQRKWKMEQKVYERMMMLKSLNSDMDMAKIEQSHKSKIYDLSDGFPHQKLIVGKDACALCFSENYWPTAWFTSAQECGVSHSPVCITKFESATTGYFSMSIEYSFDEQLGAVSQKSRAPGERIWTFAHEPAPMRCENGGMLLAYQNNIPSFFGLCEKGDEQTYNAFADKWRRIWSDKEMGAYETADKLKELLHFPLFYPAITIEGLKSVYKGSWVEILELEN